MIRINNARALANTLATVGGLWGIGAQFICWVFGPFRSEAPVAMVCDWSLYGSVALVFVAMIVELQGRKRKRVRRSPSS